MTGADAPAPPPAKRDRLAPCPHRPPCPGCPRYGEPGISADARRTLAELARRHDLPPVAVVTGETTGFRLRARLAIRGRIASPKVGLFELGTHSVVHIPNCVVHHPLVNHVANVVRRSLVDARVTSYSDTAHLGLARHLQVVIERQSRTAQVVLVANSAGSEPLAACLDLIRERLGADLHSLWFNAHAEASNTVLGDTFRHWCGPASVVEHFGEAAIHYPPGAFGQNNLEIAAEIIAHVRALVPPKSRVIEYYAGVGAIGLSILSRASELRLNELSRHSLEGLALGLNGLAATDRAKVSVVPGLAGAAALDPAAADVVIADPPRRGLDPELTRRLAAAPPARFVYVSCGLESFLADTERLVAAGRLKLVSLTAFNLIPFTDHVELVACFERT